MNTTYRSVIGRAVLYFGIALLTPLSALFIQADKLQIWPSWLSVFSIILVGTVQGLIAIRAYFDGSAQRWTDSQANIVDKTKV